MGLILDSSVLIADEKGIFDFPGFIRQYGSASPFISPITASELLMGIECAGNPDQRRKRKAYVESVLNKTAVVPFDLEQARIHSRIWSSLRKKGLNIGQHDLIIAAAAVSHDYELATLNVREFQRVDGLKVIDATGFLKRVS